MPNLRSHVPILVLAHLGLLPFLACKQDQTHVTDPSTVSSTSASESPSTSTVPTDTASPPASGSASTALKTGECNVDQDCKAAYLQCLHLAGDDKVGHCEHRKDFHLGRPLVVDGAMHVAPYVSNLATLDRDLHVLGDAAREEHASIAAFARTISELMALGAPTWLLFETQAALADEIRHTERTLDAIERLTGERPVLGALPAAAFPLRSGPNAAEMLFRDVFRGGAVGETMAAVHAERQRDESTSADLHALYEMICVDESKHAALALETLRWLLEEKPELAAVLEEERARLAGIGTIEERTFVGPLLAVLQQSPSATKAA